MTREVTHRYEDPLDRIWIGCARRIGIRVERAPGAYATSDGRGRLWIAPDDELDGDDCLAQMILHELCHSLVEGPEALERPDWGLDNQSGRDDVREHATLRVQAMLTRALGLARLLAPTTDFRSFWDALGADALEPSTDPSVVLAKKGLVRARAAPWAPHLDHALRATAALAKSVAPYGADEAGSLWSQIDPIPSAHPTGVPRPEPGARAARERCETCAWSSRSGRGRRCLSTDRAVRADWPACERWEPAPECGACGACCREAFDTIVIASDEPMVRRHPELVVLHDTSAEMPRPDGRCHALTGDGARSLFRCRTYEDRPRTCRDFARGGANCLLARRRVGLSI